MVASDVEGQANQIVLSIDKDGDETKYDHAPLGSILFNDSGIR